MRHGKTPVILLREKADALVARVQQLECELEAERKWAAYCQGRTEKWLNQKILRPQA